MRRPWVIPVLLVALLSALTWLASARLAATDPARSGRLLAGATVRSDPVTVQAPSLAAARTTAPTGQPAVAGLLVSVEVAAGSRVETGAVIARLDDRALALAITSAEAAARGARARIGMLDDGLATAASNAAKLTDAKRKLDSALAELRTTRPDVVRSLAQARQLADSLPPVLPPGMPDPRVLVAKLEAALKQIDAGLAKATAARAKLATGSAKLSDARSQLRGLRGVAVLAAEAADAGVDVATARRDLSIVRAPYTGLVTWAAEPGTVVFVGGPIARLRPDGPLLVDTYVDAAQAKLVRLGSSAEASIDSLPGRSYPGRVSAVRPVYEFPPTALPTALIHMTRAFRVTVTVDDTAAPLPPGTPADLSISTRSE